MKFILFQLPGVEESIVKFTVAGLKFFQSIKFFAVSSGPIMVMIMMLRFRDLDICANFATTAKVEVACNDRSVCAKSTF